MLNYTKGEWRLGSLNDEPFARSGLSIYREDGRRIAEVIREGFLAMEEAEANAQLIASAPDEDDCLRCFGEYIAINYDEVGKPFYYIDQEWLDMRTKALTKAEGI